MFSVSWKRTVREDKLGFQKRIVVGLLYNYMLMSNNRETIVKGVPLAVLRPHSVST